MLKLADIDKSKLSPMMKQYCEMKEENKGSLLFYRLGDFYEMFFDDAILVSKELELTLTGRDCGLEERAPMCGVPFHSVDTYIARLIKKGYKVAICEQMEDPATAKGMVRREIIRVITPGTLIENNILTEDVNNYICSLYLNDNKYGVCFADISTGELTVTEFLEDGDNRLENELVRMMPKELIFNTEFLDKKEIASFLKEKIACTADVGEEDSFEYQMAEYTVLRHFGKDNLSELSLKNMPYAVSALGALFIYLQKTQRTGLSRIQNVNIYSDKQYMFLDISARRNLELCETMRQREKKGTLLWVLDKTKTAMGKRKIRSIILQPLLNLIEIDKRLNAVEELTGNTILLSDLTYSLSGIFDIERLMTKVVYGNPSPRDLSALGVGFKKIPEIKAYMSGVQSQFLCAIEKNLDTLEDMTALIESAIIEAPPMTVRDGGVIKTGYNKELDELRYLSEHIKEIIAEKEAEEKEKTGIKNLKIGYNRVFGYYIEVSKASASQVPDNYIRKQTLANNERFITEELKELEGKALSAQQKIIILEGRLFEEVRTLVANELERIQSTAEAIAMLDVFCSFAVVSIENDYVRPIIDNSDDIMITDGRHPVVERLLRDSEFVANDTTLNCKGDMIDIITGPNMAGKSTYIRQTALIVIMAQIGCFVPAKSAKIGIVDAVFTRVGASDDLATGQSTFMVEMTEVADILNKATSKSLLILDEIGRGTSTYDGMSIARAVLEYIVDKLRAKTLFATHYHELIELSDIYPCVKNYNIAAIKRSDDIIFLRRILPGGADESYGIEVSKLAGVPKWVVNRAYEILKQIETDGSVKPAKKIKANKQAQLTFVDDKSEVLKKRLREIDTDNITARQALDILDELKKLAK